MIEDILKLAVGILLAIFHRPIGDFFLETEYAFAALIHSRGLRALPLPRRGTVHDLYFGLGLFIAIFQIGRIWLLLPR